MNLGNVLSFDWLPLLIDQSWAVRCLLCSTLVIAVTWLVAFCAARLSAAIQHRIFLLGFAGLLIVPVALAVTDGWNPRIAFYGASKIDVASRTDLPIDSSDDFINLEPESSDTSMGARVTSIPVSQVDPVGPTDPQPTERRETGSPAAISVADRSARTVDAIAAWPVSPLMPQTVFGAVWAVGACLFGIKLVLEWFLVRSIVQCGVPITDEQTVSLLQEVRRATDPRNRSQPREVDRHDFPDFPKNHDLRQDEKSHDFAGKASQSPVCGSNRQRWLPRLLCSNSTPVPIAAGILTPTIILPVGYGKWTHDRLRIVLMHELTHIDRRDVLANVVAGFACLLYWFNPLVRLAARRMCLQRELACDDYLLNLGESAERYANDLCEIAASVKRRLRTAEWATPMATQNNLKSRVQHLMTSNLDRRFVSTRASLLTTAMAVMTVMILAVISPSFGIAQSNPTGKIADLNAAAVTLSGELPRDWFEQLNAMPNLRKVTIRNPALKDFKVTQLRELKKLTEFSAEDFSIDSRLADIVAVNVAQLPQLKSIQFHRTGLTGSGLQALSQSPSAELILDGEELIAEADYKHVSKMPSLSNLVFDTMPIETDGLTALQAASGLRRLALRRHPSGTSRKGSEARLKVLAGFKQLESLELGDTGYSELVVLKTCKSLRLLTLRDGGANDASKSLTQLTQLKRIEIDNCDIRNESFDDLKSNLHKIGIVLADVTRPADDSLTQGSVPPDEATEVARRALDALDVGKHFGSFWVEWHHHWSTIPTMTAQPARTVHRLKQALTAEHEKQPWEQDTTFAYAPAQFFMRNLATTNGELGWQQITFGDAELARSREQRPDNPPLHILRNGVKEFEETMGLHIPRQFYITHQHLWWGTPTHHNITTSSVSPQKVAYVELPEENFAGEDCRVFQSPGRSERLWISKATGRLRGSLHYIHQGYYTPFYKQDVVTKIVGRRIESIDEYGKLFSGPAALAKEVQHQLTQAWSEYKFDHAYPGSLVVLDDYREIAAGKWFPFKVKSSSWHHNKADEGHYDFHVAESIVTGLAIDRDDLESVWAEFLPKAGEKIQDQRFGVAVEYPSKSDQTDDEIQTLVNERMLEFARSQIQIESLQSPFAKMIGKPAPRLSTEGWVGERPDLTGKRYLIHFWATWCGPCKNDVPLLNTIAKDRIVIGAHPGDSTVEQVSQAAKDAKMTYPTIVAARDAKDIMGYPAKMFPYCVEVDEQGNVAKHGFLNEVLGVKTRLNDDADNSTKANGTILATDEKNGLAVISIGEADGVQSKQLLDVTRDGQNVAQLRVVTIQKKRCVAKVTDQNEQATMKVGDTIVSFATAPTP